MSAELAAAMTGGEPCPSADAATNDGATKVFALESLVAETASNDNETKTNTNKAVRAPMESGVVLAPPAREIAHTIPPVSGVRSTGAARPVIVAPAKVAPAKVVPAKVVSAKVQPVAQAAWTMPQLILVAAVVALLSVSIASLLDLF
jgi:hypothetical protein